MKFVGFEAKAQGETHKEKDQPCQDAVFHKVYRGVGVAITADGHGGEKYFRSQYGAEMVVQITHEGMSDFWKLFIKDLKDKEKSGTKQRRTPYMEKQLDQLERFIITRWRQEVLKHFSENPLTDQEKSLCQELDLDMDDEKNQIRAYGTTLIAALLQRYVWFVIQIGDGKSVLLDMEGDTSFALNDVETYGKTHSLSDSNAKEHFRHAFGFNELKGMTVATDGVADSFTPGAYLKFHCQLYTDFCSNPAVAEEGVKKGVAAWSLKGSRDDASMAGVFRVPVPDTLGDKIKGIFSSVLESTSKPKLS